MNQIVKELNYLNNGYTEKAKIICRKGDKALVFEQKSNSILINHVVRDTSGKWLVRLDKIILKKEELDSLCYYINKKEEQ